MPRPLVIIGCGGHGREIHGIAQAMNDVAEDSWKILGFVDDSPSDINLQRIYRLGAPFLGRTEAVSDFDSDAQYAIGIGNPRVRAMVASRPELHHLQAARLIHPSATVGHEPNLEAGVVLFAGARVTTNVTVGQHTHLNQNCTVGHDTILGKCVQVNPLAAISGDCRIEDEVLVGTTAAVLQGLTIGAGATVGAGACVVRQVAARTTVKGVPAR